MHIASFNMFFWGLHDSKQLLWKQSNSTKEKNAKGTNGGDMKKEGMGWKEENVKGWNIWRNDKSCKIFSL